MRKFYKENKEYLISIITVLGINAISYFLIKLFIPSYNLITSHIDDKIPLIPIFIIIYMLWYPYLFISYYMVYKKDKLKYKKLIINTAISIIIANLCYIIYPTMVNRPQIDNNGIINKILILVYKLDTPVNCLPSMHCLLSFLIMFTVLFDKTMSKKLKITTSIISTSIVLSTLFVKQHVVIDVLLALIIALILNIERRKN